MGILKIVFGIFAVIMTVLYYTGIYFSIYDEEAQQDKKQKAERNSYGGKNM